MPPVDRTAFWRRLEESSRTPEFREFVERAFPALAPDLTSGADRRTFLKLMGASLAMAGLTACRWPKERIVPFAHRPEGRVPGQPEQYATAMDLAGAAVGLLVTSYDGRPIKVEGNPNHPDSLGAAGVFAQASVLELYDPDRSRSVVERRGREEFRRSWDEFGTFARTHFTALSRNGGAGLHVLAEASSSPSAARLRTRFGRAFPRAVWREYEPLTRDNERAGLTLAFGQPLRALYDFTKAEVVASLDADFLLDHPAALRHAREFASRRAGDVEMNRLWVVESVPSITGAAADHRHVLPSAAVSSLALWLAAELAPRALPAPWLSGALERALASAMKQPGRPEFAPLLADDLYRCGGGALVLAGPRQPAEVHALAHLVNLALGSVGGPVRYVAEPDPGRIAHGEAIAALVADMKAGAVDTLIVLGGDPMYNAPADLDFREALGRVKSSIHLGLHANETGRACSWRLPRAHFLESWGDARGWDGVVSVVQPLIEPLFGGKTAIEVLALVMGEEKTNGYDIVRATFGEMVGAGDAAWRSALDQGVAPGTAFATLVPVARPEALAARLAGWPAPAPAPAREAAEVVFLPSASVFDGRFANNAWLQETPDPVTKVVWDNVAVISPTTADALAVTDGDVVRLSAGGRDLDVPVTVTPGTAPFSIGLALGYGRAAGGVVAEGVGANAYGLRTTSALHAVRGVAVQATGRRRTLASTQVHWAIEPLGRKETERRAEELAREWTYGEYALGREHEATPRLFSLWQEHKYEGHAWAMAIDLSACIGCNACVVACQAENNIPVVGRDQVARGREMNWLRVDRYFVGESRSPRIAFQPVACVHCENAPCEQVCPVGATVHSQEGLNQMVYNRCIGTRYCANNCPFKVRRFNFLNYHRHLSELQMMQHNPEVTVRSRGVMEKCTYCIQRIEAARIRARAENRPIADGEIVPACAQACPTRAIVFGDLNDAGSRVRALHADRRAYALLGELNVRPRTWHLARLRNPATSADGGDLR